MSEGKLSKIERDKLCKWIGQSVDFKLLYKASRDGMSPAIFQRRIVNKGPTVIACWNTDGCVFGGYTSVNWVVTGDHQYDQKAFIFRLKYNKEHSARKFPVSDAQNAILFKAGCSPCFGAGPDLEIFRLPAQPAAPAPAAAAPAAAPTVAPSEVTKNANGVFENALTPDFGKSYQSGGVTMKEISNNNFNYEEVEVYQVPESMLLTVPWRADRNENLATLKKLIEDYVPLEDVGVRQARILLIGSVGAGKSSYFNTINSIFRGHVTGQANTGSAEASLTTMFRIYQIRSCSTPLKLRLCDTRGLEDTEGIDPGDLSAMLDGHMPDRYTFLPSSPISSGSLGYIKTPTINEKIHCIAFVIDSGSVDVMNESVLSKFKQIQKLANQRSIPQVILLSKVDQIGVEVENNLTNVLYSSRVAYVVDQVAQLIGLPRGHVLPVKNYEKETELNETVDRFALLSLQQMLRFADDYMYDSLD
ncbi:interferon-induced protein 44-like [Patella vulgata]|uniref:interferon-induced protein 44-like n=1 Tax=Patella vulgata TaxID=6465 RepID=UPI00217F891A|nr:interferon-induced protein 44-like [Patella vulgata]